MSQGATIDFHSPEFEKQLQVIKEWDNGKNTIITLVYEEIPLSVKLFTVIEESQKGTLGEFCIKEKAAINKAMKDFVKRAKEDKARESMKVVKGPSERRKKRHPHNPAGHRGSNQTPSKKRRK